MAILTDPPEWRVPGPKPPRNIIEEQGWEVASHPPAPWFNWFFHRVFESLLELESATLARVVNEAGVPSIMAGPESERPAASQETAGRIYIATDTKRMFRDRGNGWDLLNTPDAIGAETPVGAQTKAEAAANAALASAKSYADDVVAAHANRTDNPHGVTKAQVGLGNVENYGVATQAEAEAGSVNNKYMTPLRVAQAIAALHANRTDNPHQVTAPQVPYSSGVSGFTPATVKAALDELAGARIVEMGSNSNGTYVRWENGLQICFGGQRATRLVNAHTYFLSWTYPAAFVGAPTAVGARSSDGTNKAIRLVGPNIREISNEGALYYINDPDGGFADGETWYVYPIAIGRWQ